MANSESVAIVGSGIMACAIAEMTSENSANTLIIARSEESANKARTTIEASRKMAVRRKRIDQESADAATNCLNFSTEVESAADCDLIIEAVIEDFDIKTKVLAEICRVCRTDTTIATNTSALSVSDLSKNVSNPERFLGLHFMNPPTTVKLVEVACAENTSSGTLEKAHAFCKEMGLQTVDVADRHGYIVNRLLMAMINETAHMIEDNVATPQQIDKAMRLACGHPMGPAALADFIGLDTVCSELETFREAFGERFQPADLIKTLVENGELGRKSKRGMMQCKKD